MFNTTLEEIAVVEKEIEALVYKLEQAKQTTIQWADASVSLSRSAAEARAKNQGMGRGIGGILLGSKFRSAMRSAAAISNAAIAKDVAEKRSRITEGKRESQEIVRSIKTGLAVKKQLLKSLKAIVKPNSSPVKASVDSVALLKKLKEAHDLGLLTDDEYEQKRKKLVLSI